MPNEPPSVRIFRKRNISTEAETIEIAPEQPVQPATEKKEYTLSPKSMRTNLCVRLPNSKVIENRVAYETMQAVVMMAGPEKVRTLEIIQNRAPLVSATLITFT